MDLRERAFTDPRKELILGSAILLPVYLNDDLYRQRGKWKRDVEDCTRMLSHIFSQQTSESFAATHLMISAVQFFFSGIAKRYVTMQNVFEYSAPLIMMGFEFGQKDDISLYNKITSSITSGV